MVSFVWLIRLGNPWAHAIDERVKISKATDNFIDLYDPYILLN